MLTQLPATPVICEVPPEEPEELEELLEPEVDSLDELELLILTSPLSYVFVTVPSDPAATVFGTLLKF